LLQINFALGKNESEAPSVGEERPPNQPNSLAMAIYRRFRLHVNKFFYFPWYKRDFTTF